MDINISDEIVEKMVEESVRKRVKEMQGTYTSKAYITNRIDKIVRDKMDELCPSIDSYINNKIMTMIQEKFKNTRGLTNQKIVEYIVDALIYELLNHYEVDNNEY